MYLAARSPSLRSRISCCSADGVGGSSLGRVLDGGSHVVQRPGVDILIRAIESSTSGYVPGFTIPG
jgi:hypothetical protein